MLTIVGLSHAEDMALRATRGVAHNHHSALQLAEADDATFTVLLANILDLDRHTLEDNGCVLEVQATLIKCLLALGWIEGDSHRVSVYTLTICCKPSRPGRLRRLTFELTGLRRQDALARTVKMYRVPPAGPRWPAVAGPVERVVRRHPAVLLAA